MDHSMPGFPVHHQLLELPQTHVHWVGDAIQPSHPLLSLSPPAFYLSQHQGLLNESVLRITWPTYWSFSFSISPSNDYSGLISFRIDWLDPIAVQGTLKSLLQHHSSKASVLWHSAFFIVQLSHPSIWPILLNMRYGSNFIFFQMANQLSGTIYYVSFGPSVLIYLCFILNFQAYLDLFLSYFVFPVYLSIHIPMLHCFNYRGST